MVASSGAVALFDSDGPHLWLSSSATTCAALHVVIGCNDDRGNGAAVARHQSAQPG
jgi:hypothetical protein